MKKVLSITVAVLTLVVLIVGGYLAYALPGYRRIEDNIELDVRNAGNGALPVGKTLTALTWNVGYGANDAENSFFLDGGEKSRARSKDAVLENTAAFEAVFTRENADIIVLQEIDTDSDRSFFVNQVETVRADFAQMDSVYARNVHTRFLMYPMPLPIGRMNGGLLTLVRAEVTDAIRRSLPIESGLGRLIDLDRCYSISDVTVEGGKTLTLIDVHLSAYAQDDSIRLGQMEMLFGDMVKAREAGNYVIVGGDFNSCLAGAGNPEYTWAKPFDVDRLPEGFTVVSEEGAEHSCRNLDTPYDPDRTYTCTVDGFLVSDDVRVEEVTVLAEGYKNSDHNPVRMRFVLE